MAKFTITGDTETNELSVKVDGEEVAGVHCASAYKYSGYDENYKEYEKCGFSAEVRTTSENGVKTYTMICANDKGLTSMPKVEQEISDFIKRKK